MIASLAASAKVCKKVTLLKEVIEIRLNPNLLAKGQCLVRSDR